MLIRITLIDIIPFGRIDIFIIVFPSKDGASLHLLLFCFMSFGNICTVHICVLCLYYYCFIVFVTSVNGIFFPFAFVNVIAAERSY